MTSLSLRATSTRYARKGFSPDPLGIFWEADGEGQRHEAGTRWNPEEWKRFRDWAHENGGQMGNMAVHWNNDIGDHHREDGPAYVSRMGYTVWGRNGQRHREDGPALILPSGYKAWWLNGQRHREDGPARIRADGTQEWWLEDIRYTDETFTTTIEDTS